MKAMIEIKILTTIRNEEFLGGIARNGDVVKVPQDYAKDLVENKGYADYIDQQFQVMKTPQGEFPKKFLQEEIPSDFPTEKVGSKLRQNDIYTFEALVSHEDYGDIKGIGEKYAEILGEGVTKALDEWTDARNQG